MWKYAAQRTHVTANNATLFGDFVPVRMYVIAPDTDWITNQAVQKRHAARVAAAIMPLR
jgi:hypothetical protein